MQSVQESFNRWLHQRLLQLLVVGEELCQVHHEAGRLLQKVVVVGPAPLKRLGDEFANDMKMLLEALLGTAVLRVADRN